MFCRTGKSKVFIRFPEVVFALEESRARKLDDIARSIQRAYLAYAANRFYIKLRAKSTELFFKNKDRRRVSVNRTFAGDYLCLASNGSIQKMLQKNGETQVLFSGAVNKINNRYKVQTRWLLISDKSIYYFGPPNATSKNPTLKRRLFVNQLVGISLSPMTDGYFVLHFPQP